MPAADGSGPFHAEMFQSRSGCTIVPIVSMIQNMERARQMDVATGKGKNHQPYYDPSDPSAFDRTAVVLLMIAKKDAPKRFEFFCVEKRSAPTSSCPSGEEILQFAGVRLVMDYGNHLFQDFRR